MMKNWSIRTVIIAASLAIGFYSAYRLTMFGTAEFFKLVDKMEVEL